MNDCIIFLDYDGVVNTVYWGIYKGQFKADYSHPHMGFVNNYQAICWLNELYKKNPYDIVVTSTWRMSDNYKECLYNGGLNKNIKIIGRTPILHTTRGDEIKEWLITNKYDGRFVIIDDENIIGDLAAYLVKCDPNYGFGIKEMFITLDKLRNFKKEECPISLKKNKK